MADKGGPVKLSALTAMRNNMGDSWESAGSGVRRVSVCLYYIQYPIMN